MDTEDQSRKDIKLITSTKKKRLKIQRLDSEKYNIKNTKQDQSQKLLKNIYEICFIKC